ncbi:CPBP family intramembrane metalloprotease [Clostridium fermenticellae]|uniref:CPBP family intramembrane metalloprotease n=1 Tax=Clostridium fermenticellae TaxID=2068654 RepID=A0A386H1F2_9CLOT|nr:type II CAAX endopeptidase family protein [Clostridium fermenticellae]AYD39522.1 CPBP family intramembrane metalloprotease [Clostridium fermenticellae]
MSNLNPFKILSNLENRKSKVKILSVTDAVIAAICYILILSFLLGIGFSIIDSFNNIILQSFLSIFALAVIFFIVTSVFYWYYITNPGKDKIESRPVKKLTLPNILLLILIVLGYLLFFDALLMPIDRILPGFNLVTKGIPLIYKSPLILIGYLSIVPLLTEFVFRGIILEGLSKKYSDLKALMICSLISGISAFNPAGFMCTFILGILLGYLYIKTHSLCLCIIGDILYSIVTFILIQYYPQFLLLISSNILIISLLTITGLLIMYFGLKKLFSNIKKTNLQ